MVVVLEDSCGPVHIGKSLLQVTMILLIHEASMLAGIDASVVGDRATR